MTWTRKRPLRLVALPVLACHLSLRKPTSCQMQPKRVHSLREAMEIAFFKLRLLTRMTPP